MDLEELEDDNVVPANEEEENANNNDSNDNFNYSDLSEGGWISWFCQMEGNEFFVEINEEYLKNPMNLFGLSTLKKNYKYLNKLN
jgi:casein kinase II subunit beta